MKMSGSGNDFIMVDNRAGLLDPNGIAPWVKAVCRRSISVGADGVILLADDPAGEVDFAWRYFNSDASEADMCGNGGRCAVRYAFDLGLAGKESIFRTKAGLIKGWVLSDGETRLQLTSPRNYRAGIELSLPVGQLSVSLIDTGVPHVVCETSEIENFDVKSLGAAIRFHPEFAPEGANANFVQVRSGQEVVIRTYERGVEDETLACGTGCAAAAVSLAIAGKVTSPVRLVTRGGEVLTVSFLKNDNDIEQLALQGAVRYVAEGSIMPEAWL